MTPPFPDPTSTESRILDAALELFAEKGFAGTSIGDIIDRAGARNRAAVCYYFKSKESLYQLALKEASRRLCDDGLDEIEFPDGATAIEKLAEYIRRMTRHVIEAPEPAALQLMMREMFQPTTRACEEWVDQYIHAKSDRLREILEEILPAGTPAEALWSAQFSIVGQCLFYRQNLPCLSFLMGKEATEAFLDVDRLAERILRFSLGGLAAFSELHGGPACPSVAGRPN